MPLYNLMKQIQQTNHNRNKLSRSFTDVTVMSTPFILCVAIIKDCLLHPNQTHQTFITSKISCFTFIYLVLLMMIFLSYLSNIVYNSLINFWLFKIKTPCIGICLKRHHIIYMFIIWERLMSPVVRQWLDYKDWHAEYYWVREFNAPLPSAILYTI